MIGCFPASLENKLIRLYQSRPHRADQLRLSGCREHTSLFGDHPPGELREATETAVNRALERGYRGLLIFCDAHHIVCQAGESSLLKAERQITACTRDLPVIFLYFYQLSPATRSRLLERAAAYPVCALSPIPS